MPVPLRVGQRSGGQQDGTYTQVVVQDMHYCFRIFHTTVSVCLNDFLDEPGTNQSGQ